MFKRSIASFVLSRFLLDWNEIRRKRRKTRRLAVVKTGRRKNRTYYYGVGRYFTQFGDIPYHTKLCAYVYIYIYNKEKDKNCMRVSMKLKKTPIKHHRHHPKLLLLLFKYIKT